MSPGVRSGLREPQPAWRPDGAVLLDTNAIIRAQLGHRLTPEAVAAIERAQADLGLLISIVSVWELGLLARNRTSPTGRIFTPDLDTWLDRVMGMHGVRMAPMTPEMVLAAWRLPEPVHGDPADRLLIAVARALSVPIITRDRAILDYAALGHVQAIAC